MKTQFRPMLAAAVPTAVDLSFPLLASPKLDGVRCIIMGGVALSRSLKPIPNQRVQRLFGQAEFEGLDGELIVGSPTAKDVFQVTTSGVMKRAGEPLVSFQVFDHITCSGGFTTRLTWATRRAAPTRAVYAVEHQLVRTVEELFEYEERMLGLGYEGAMLRHPDGPYKTGRSTLREGYLLKLKRFQDDEAVIVDVMPLYHNDNPAELDERGYTKRSSKQAGKVPLPKLGALVCLTRAGVEFELGTGFSDDQRTRLWAVRHRLPGLTVKYKHQPVGAKDKPRLPVFLGFRSTIDM